MKFLLNYSAKFNLSAWVAQANSGYCWLKLSTHVLYISDKIATINYPNGCWIQGNDGGTQGRF